MNIHSLTSARPRESINTTWLVATLVAGTLAVQAYYFWTLDYAWFGDYVVQLLPSSVRSQLPGPVLMSRQSLMLPGTLVAAFKPLAAIALLAVYLMVLSRALSEGIDIIRAFKRVAIVTVPYILLLPLEAFQLLRNHNGQLPVEALDLTTLNALVLHAAPGSPPYQIANALSLTLFVSAGLFAMVIHRELKGALSRDCAIAFLPYLLSLLPTVVLTLIH